MKKKLAEEINFNPSRWWINGWLRIAHNGTACALLVIGIVFKIPNIWVHGFLTQLSMDIRDIIYIALTKAKICGNIQPWAMASQSYTKSTLLHNLVSICISYPIINNFRYDPKIQMFVF